MKVDHLVINVDKKYQLDTDTIEKIRKAKFPYEPKWGKGTRGFKASNLWIGEEYFEMINILQPDGGGWKSEWTRMYNQGHRGLCCLMLDVDNIDDIYISMNKENIDITKPEWLEFKWFFNLLKRKMPWKNCYLPIFEGIPFQIGFQQMKDQKSREFMNEYMVPNSRDNGINGINKIKIYGEYSEKDLKIIQMVFKSHAVIGESSIIVDFSINQSIDFIKAPYHKVEVYTNSNENSSIKIENIKVFC